MSPWDRFFCILKAFKVSPITIQIFRAKSYADSTGAAIDQQTVNQEALGAAETQSLH
jgi:hypothetical protein